MIVTTTSGTGLDLIAPGPADANRADQIPFQDVLNTIAATPDARSAASAARTPESSPQDRASAAATQPSPAQTPDTQDQTQNAAAQDPAAAPGSDTGSAAEPAGPSSATRWQTALRPAATHARADQRANTDDSSQPAPAVPAVPAVAAPATQDAASVAATSSTPAASPAVPVPSAQTPAATPQAVPAEVLAPASSIGHDADVASPPDQAATSPAAPAQKAPAAPAAQASPAPAPPPAVRTQGSASVRTKTRQDTAAEPVAVQQAGAPDTAAAAGPATTPADQATQLSQGQATASATTAPSAAEASAVPGQTASSVTQVAAAPAAGASASVAAAEEPDPSTSSPLDASDLDQARQALAGHIPGSAHRTAPERSDAPAAPASTTPQVSAAAIASASSQRSVKDTDTGTGQAGIQPGAVAPPASGSNVTSQLLTSAAPASQQVTPAQVPAALVQLAQVAPTSARLVMTPDHLGQVRVVMTVNAGRLSVTLHGTPQALAHLSRQDVTSALASAGIKVDQVTLTPTTSPTTAQQGGDDSAGAQQRPNGQDPADSRQRREPDQPEFDLDDYKQ